jgi:predicted nucleic acid-binding protein
MSARVFLDTNILVYGIDSSQKDKQRRALEILEGSAKDYRDVHFVLSTQVLQEFYATAAGKLAVPLDESDAERAVTRLARLPVVQVDTQMILDAIATSREHGLKFWDALIVRAALDAGCDTLLTEDLQHDQVFDGLRVQNPFLDSA